MESAFVNCWKTVFILGDCIRGSSVSSKLLNIPRRTGSIAVYIQAEYHSAVDLKCNGQGLGQNPSWTLNIQERSLWEGDVESNRPSHLKSTRGRVHNPILRQVGYILLYRFFRIDALIHWAIRSWHCGDTSFIPFSHLKEITQRIEWENAFG